MVDIPSLCSGLTQGANGIWYSSEQEAVSYPSEGNQACLAIEDASFWFRHRNECIVSMVRSYPPAGQGVVFDVGGGNGYVAMGLVAAGFEVVLIEPGETGATNARARGVKHVVCATTATARFKPGSIPGVGLFDVLEHIEDDLAFLRSMAELLVPQGRLYITVPAYSFLWSAQDESAGHFRRYTTKQLRRLLGGAGLQVDFSSYMFWFLPIPVFVFRALPYRLGMAKSRRSPQRAAREHITKGGAQRALLDHLLGREVERFRTGKPVRFGGSCVAVARKA